MEKKLVYKFRDCENEFHRRILLQDEIYFAAPKSFNDPFDCHIDYDFSNLTEAEREEYINDQIQLLKEEELFDIDFTEEDVRKEFENSNKLLELQNEYNEKNFNDLNSNIGVFCCCQNTKNEKGWQNIMLWSHYANSHKGFCVGIDKDLLCSKFTNGHLNVKPIYPILKPLVPIEKNTKKIIENYKEEIFSKFMSWEYENELRFIKINTDKGNFNGLNQEDRTVILPQDFIVEVTMGLWIDDYHKNAITTICKRKGIKLYQVEKEPFKFSITRIEIDLS